jgi:hypothetical protein
MPRMRCVVLTFALLLSPLVTIRVLLAQDSLKFNVPYLCPDGSTYVVHRCETGPKGEFCFYQRDRDSERFNRRSDVANQKAANWSSNFRTAPGLFHLSCNQTARSQAPEMSMSRDVE